MAQQRHDAGEGSPVDRDAAAILEAPAEPCGREAESGWLRPAAHLVDGHVPPQQRADAVVERVAGRENADGPTPAGENIRKRVFDG
jgi:hypothetical protein